jgi:hypothetical protein
MEVIMSLERSAGALSQATDQVETVSFRILKELNASLESQTALCNELEVIADTVPDLVDRTLCAFTAIDLSQLLESERRLQAEAMNPDPDMNDQGNYGNKAIRQMMAEHGLDQTSFGYVADLLEKIGNDGPIEEADALRLMLRTLVDDVRDHMAFEREHVVPIFERLNGETGQPDGRRFDGRK